MQMFKFQNQLKKRQTSKMIVLFGLLLIAASTTQNASLFAFSLPNSLPTTKFSFMAKKEHASTSTCGPYCNFCTFYYCQDCQTGTYLQNSSCFQCPMGCKSCSNPSTCDSCLDGFFFMNGICQSCGIGCSKCSDANGCRGCFEGFFMVENQKCNSCLQGCGKCKDTIKCSECKSGWDINDDGTQCSEQGWFVKNLLWIFIMCIFYICCFVCIPLVMIISSDHHKH